MFNLEELKSPWIIPAGWGLPLCSCGILNITTVPWPSKMPEPFSGVFVGNCSPFLHCPCDFSFLTLPSCWCWTSVSRAFGNVNLNTIELQILPAESSGGFLAIHSSLSSILVMETLHSSPAWLDSLSVPSYLDKKPLIICFRNYVVKHTWLHLVYVFLAGSYGNAMWNSVRANKDCISEWPYHFWAGRCLISCWCMHPLLFYRIGKLEGTWKAVRAAPVPHCRFQCTPDLPGVS